MIRELQKNEISLVDSILKENEYSTLDNNPFSKYLVYEENQIIKGYLEYALLYERIEINFIGVKKEYQNKKIASKLIEYLINIGISNKCENISLEVKENNYNALKLYQKYDFLEVSKRHGYYNGIDGILMVRELIN